MSINSKRAQENIITIVLLILIVIVAMIIVWNFIQPLIKRTSGRIETGALTVNLNLDKTTIELGNVSNISIKRSAGKGDLIGIRFVFTDGINEYVYTNYTVPPKELETKKYSIDLTNDLPDATGVKIYPIVKNQAGEEAVGSLQDTFGTGF